MGDGLNKAAILEELLVTRPVFGACTNSDGSQDIIISDSANRMVRLSIGDAVNLSRYLAAVIKFDSKIDDVKEEAKAEEEVEENKEAKSNV